MICESLGPLNTEYAPKTCTVEPHADYFLLRYAVSCLSLCDTKSSFALRVTEGIQNPSWIPSLVDSIEVKTFTSDLAYKIDQRTSGLETSPALEEGSIQSMTFEKSPGQVGESTSFSFGMLTLNMIPVGGYI